MSPRELSFKQRSTMKRKHWSAWPWLRIQFQEQHLLLKNRCAATSIHCRVSSFSFVIYDKWLAMYVYVYTDIRTYTLINLLIYYFDSMHDERFKSFDFRWRKSFPLAICQLLLMPGIKIDHVCSENSNGNDQNAQSDLEIAVSLGQNDLRIYQKVAGKWKLIHTLTEHLSRVLAIDWAPKTNQIVSASAVRSPSIIFAWWRSRRVWFI